MPPPAPDRGAFEELEFPDTPPRPQDSYHMVLRALADANGRVPVDLGLPEWPHGRPRVPVGYYLDEFYSARRLLSDLNGFAEYGVRHYSCY